MLENKDVTTARLLANRQLSRRRERVYIQLWPLQTPRQSSGHDPHPMHRFWGRAWRSSEDAAGRAPETVRSHLKGAECEANLLHVYRHARRHTQTRKSRVRVEQKTQKQIQCAWQISCCLVKEQRRRTQAQAFGEFKHLLIICRTKHYSHVKLWLSFCCYHLLHE